jgi:hypothetical protein
VAQSTKFLLLETFADLFRGHQYNHRDSSLGDRVAACLAEDLYRLDKSALLRVRVAEGSRVTNEQNLTVGKKGRRGDGTFGEIVPVAAALTREGFHVKRGPVATVEIGTETKVLAKAMIKQIDRVIGDLVRQVEEFRRRGGNPLCVAVVGVNFAEQYTSFEGTRSFPTDGKKYKHPVQEAVDAIRRLDDRAKPAFDEFQVLRFRASNTPPFPFEWLDEARVRMEYAALLTRVSREYDRRFV